MKIPLFDIDWTLLEGGDIVHSNSYDFALHTVYNQPTASKKEIVANGMIDTQILIEILKLHNINERTAKNKMEEAIKAMEKYYHNHPEKGIIKTMPGVINLLEELKKRGVFMGLLTGNIESIGWHKVKRAGINKYFSFGSFGNLAFKRADLIPIAKNRAEKILNKKINLKDLFIIGDSPLDVSCAKTAKIQSVAIASGRFSFEELKITQPDLLLNSLNESEKFIKFLLN